MTSHGASDDDLLRAAHVLDRGGVVAHASEGVWGLACDPFDRAAVERILAIKGRDGEKGLIVVAGRPEAFSEELSAVDGDTSARIRASWPGAVTWVVPNHRFPVWITGGRDTVAIRVPGHAQARALAEVFGGPIVSTSANRSAAAAARSARQVEESLGEEIDFILPGEIGSRDGPSRIVNAVSGKALR